MPNALSSAVRQRARGRCEYCRFPESEADLPFTNDHVRPRKHGGTTELENLALACPACNSHKGTNLTGIDPDSDRPVILFNPRTQRWYDHFRWDGIRIVGQTPTGRATVRVIGLNDESQLGLRMALVRSGWFFRADL